MKKLYTIVFVFILGLIIYCQFEKVFAVYAFSLTLLFVVLILDRINIFLVNKEYAKQFENIYVIHKNPLTGEEPELPEILQGLVVITSYKKVCEEIKNQEFLLHRSGNLFYCDPALTNDQRLCVKGIIMQDGEFINEDFDEYVVRLIDEIREDRRKRHLMLKKTSPSWYNQFANFQKGVIWKNKS